MVKKTMGIDVDSKELNVCVMRDENRANAIWKEVKNDKEDFNKVLELLNQEQVEIVLMEASGGYEQKIALFLAQKGAKVMVINPVQVRHFARGIGLKCKNDKTDAYVLGRMAQVIEVKSERQTSPRQIELKQLVVRRCQIAEYIAVQKKLLIKAESEALKSIQRHIEFLSEEQAKLEALINKIISQDAVMTKKKNVLTKVKGVGAVTAASLIALLPELGYIGNKQISHLVGLAPMDHDSGDRKGKRFISGGRPRVRKALFMPALVAIQRDPGMNAVYQRFVKAGKPKKVAIIAIMRKLIIRLNATYRKHLKTQNISAPIKNEKFP